MATNFLSWKKENQLQMADFFLFTGCACVALRNYHPSLCVFCYTRHHHKYIPLGQWNVVQCKKPTLFLKSRKTKRWGHVCNDDVFSHLDLCVDFCFWQGCNRKSSVYCISSPCCFLAKKPWLLLPFNGNNETTNRNWLCTVKLIF